LKEVDSLEGLAIEETIKPIITAVVNPDHPDASSLKDLVGEESIKQAKTVCGSSGDESLKDLVREESIKLTSTTEAEYVHPDEDSLKDLVREESIKLVTTADVNLVHPDDEINSEKRSGGSNKESLKSLVEDELIKLNNNVDVNTCHPEESLKDLVGDT